jgi:hypothetical protein
LEFDPSTSDAMMTPASFQIGTPGIPWGEAEVATWLSLQTIKRSYETGVLRVIDTLRSRYDVVQYGQLDHLPRNMSMCLRHICSRV